MFNPAKAADEIKKAYIGYISTTFHFRNQDLQEKLLLELNNTIAKGPFIEIKDSFRTGKSIEQLISNGVLSSLFRFLEYNKSSKPKLPLQRPLYLHQERAIESVVNGRNVVISTGTGSGKTACFLIPVINELLNEIEKNTLNDGVRAIFIYPMNALASDQIKGLREILLAYPKIRFGVYNGGTENREEDAIKLYELMYANESQPELRKKLPNEELSREKMKLHPPHILFTNYAMLEHMLFRPGDDTIFSNSNFKYVVLDEAHVYAGATGIETAFLIGRLKGRIRREKDPQFILTSATLGDNTIKSKKQVVEFAERLTGASFEVEDIITAYREDFKQPSIIQSYHKQLFFDLADEELSFEEVLRYHHLDYSYSETKEPEILFDILSSSKLFTQLRLAGGLLELIDCSNKLGLTVDETIKFVALCSRAIKEGKPLVDIRYHYFLKALDGCYLAIGHKDSLSLVRKSDYTTSFQKSVKMFEIAVCEDCGESAIVGKYNNGKLERASFANESDFYQIRFSDDLYEDEDNEQLQTVQKITKSKKRIEDINFVLCVTCGAIVAENEAHNKWCSCGDTQIVRLSKITGKKKSRCLNCNGVLRRFNLGYDAASGVVATALYENIPEYKVEVTQENTNQSTNNLFLSVPSKKKNKIKTGSQFLVFSDSRQGAAKFACFMSDSYKEFLRRRGIWRIIELEESNYRKGLDFSDFASLLENYFASIRLFRKSNSEDQQISNIENRRNAWVAILNELYNSNRSTSLVSLGKLSFEYLGNNDEIVRVVSEKYKVSEQDAKNFLNYLAFEIVRSAAIVTDKESDISPSDREYLFFTPYPRVITKTKDKTVFNSQSFIPTSRNNDNNKKDYYRSNKLLITSSFLNLSYDESVQFLVQYWVYLCSESNNYRLRTNDGKGFCISTNSFKVDIGKNAVVWRCKKCAKATQFNIGYTCIQIGCDGELERVNSTELTRDNYYAILYKSEKTSPLFIKEHTAQLSKKEALDYQQQFVRKEINALSCSTTFEMGVDIGELETVFLRNIPPMPSNYAQRVGRAGRTINAAAFAVTFAKLSSHDFTFFDHPEEMINGVISPPSFSLDNNKILKRHIYAVAFSLFLKINPHFYSGNNAEAFINKKGYKEFVSWLESHPEELICLLKSSINGISDSLKFEYLTSFKWLEGFIGSNGVFTKVVSEYEQNVTFLQKEYEKAMRARDENAAIIFKRKYERFQKNDLIDFLVRANLLPKYGFPVDSVELTQNLASQSFKSLSLSRDLSIAIAEYAPSSEVVADGKLYTSRYIRKPIVNRNEMTDFDVSYLAECPECKNTIFSTLPVSIDGKHCLSCNRLVKQRDFHKSIEPRSGFIAEQEVKDVPLSSQERKYKTDAVYIGDKNAVQLSKYDFKFNNISIEVESTINDSLVIRSTSFFYVCQKCGYTLANEETSKLKEYDDYKEGVSCIKITNSKHKNPFGKGDCNNSMLLRYNLHHELKTDVAKITFKCDTSDYATMISVMYALLNAFAIQLNIERREIKACLTFKVSEGKIDHKIIIYDAVPGGAGHSRRIVAEGGEILNGVIKRAINLLKNCVCSPSCYSCLRNYENQKLHEILDREKALLFLSQCE